MANRFASIPAVFLALLVCTVCPAHAQTDNAAVANGALEAQPEPAAELPTQPDLADIELQPIGSLSHRADASPGVPSQRRNTGLLGAYGRTLTALLVVVLAVVIVARLVRPWLQRMRHVQGGTVIEVLARAYVGPKQSLCLVRLGRKLHLVGLSPDHISPVACIDDPNEIAELLSQCASNRPGSITREFDRLLRGREKDLLQDDLPPSTEPVGFVAQTTMRTVDRFRRRLRQLSRSPMSEGA